MWLWNLGTETKGHTSKKTKDRRDEIHETPRRIQFITPQKKLYFRRTWSRPSRKGISTVWTKMFKSYQQDGKH